LSASHAEADRNGLRATYEVGNAATTLTALSDALKTCDLERRRQARPEIEGRIAAAWANFDVDRRSLLLTNAGPIRPERVMAELQPLLTAETTVVADASYSSMWIIGQLKALAPGMRFLTPRGLAGLGWGLPMAIGAKVADPRHPVVALVGDGGLAHSWAELETLVRSNIAITIVLLNNGVLGYQRDAETVKFGRYTSACHFAPVDHAAIARACGCEAMRVDNANALPAILRNALSSTTATFIEVMTDPEAHPPISLYADGIARRVGSARLDAA
jgi:acetolactate synthase I/II/III large subunit